MLHMCVMLEQEQFFFYQLVLCILGMDIILVGICQQRFWTIVLQIHAQVMLLCYVVTKTYLV